MRRALHTGRCGPPGPGRRGRSCPRGDLPVACPDARAPAPQRSRPAVDCGRSPEDGRPDVAGTTPMIAALAGGVGAARLLRGMVEVVPARGHHRHREHRRRHGPPRPAHLPRPGHRAVHPGRRHQPRHRVGPGRRDLAGDGVAAPTGRDHLVQPRGQGPRHPLLPDPAPERRGGRSARSPPSWPAPSAWMSVWCRSPTTRSAPGSSWPTVPRSGSRSTSSTCATRWR